MNKFLHLIRAIRRTRREITKMDTLDLKYLDFLNENLTSVGKILKHQLFILFVFSTFFLYLAFIYRSPEPIIISFINMKIRVDDIIIYCPLILGFSYASFSIFQFHRITLINKMINTIRKLGLKKHSSLNKEITYIIYPNIMDVIDIVKKSSSNILTKSIFYIISYIQVIVIYLGPIAAQFFLVSRSLELVKSQNIVLTALLYGSFVLPLSGLLVVTQEAQSKFYLFIANAIKGLVTLIILPFTFLLKGKKEYVPQSYLVRFLSALLFFVLLIISMHSLFAEPSASRNLFILLIVSSLLSMILNIISSKLDKKYKKRKK